jgi:starch phosphorylase
MFLFGLTADQITELRAVGYRPWIYYESDPELKACLDMIGDGAFTPDDPTRHASIRDSLLAGGDHYILLADYRSYMDAQEQIDRAFQNSDDWSRRALLNVANMGHFSADRAIHEYAEKVWNVKPLTY